MTPIPPIAAILARELAARACGAAPSAITIGEGDLRVLLQALEQANPVRPRWRHKKRGSSYTEIGRAALQTSTPVSQGAALVVYRTEDGDLAARPETEFMDGRFEPLP